MNTKNFGAVVLSLLLLDALPAALHAHEGHEHGRDRGEYQNERGDSGRYDPRDDDDQWDGEDGDEDREEDTYSSSPRRYPPPERERRAPREHRGKPQ